MLQVLTGLMPHMVLQRNRRDRSDALITGRSDAAGPVRATVRKAGKVVSGYRAKRIGAVQRGRFTARLTGLPVGGPYDIELTVGNDTLTVPDVLVGDVWILGGQSNMQGCGYLADRIQSDARLRACYMDDRWDVAEDPIHVLRTAADEIHRGSPAAAAAGVGPAVPFGLDMLAATGIPQGFLANAHGGTTMTQWDPKLGKLGGKSLYGSLHRRMQLVGGQFAGLLWYQGESDALDNSLRPYTDRMKKFVATLRRDARHPRLPVVIVQLGRHILPTSEPVSPWDSIREQQRRLPSVIPHLTVVPAIDLQLDDNIHIGARGHVILGQRMAYALRAMLAGAKAGRPPIDVQRLSVRANRSNGWGEVHVKFRNLVGQFQCDGLPSGFSLWDSTGQRGIFDVLLRGDTAILRTSAAPQQLQGTEVCYGRGRAPVCNLRDEAGRSPLAFGPLRVGKPHYRGPFAQAAWVSELLPGRGDLSALQQPNLKAVKQWQVCPSAPMAGFLDMHLLTTTVREDRMLLYRVPFVCPEAMRLTPLVGYDGPVKVWIDGQLVGQDPKGLNPAFGDKLVCQPVKLARGRHEAVIALSTNLGRAWGVMLRFERLDTTAAQRRQFDLTRDGIVFPQWTPVG